MTYGLTSIILRDSEGQIPKPKIVPWLYGRVYSYCYDNASKHNVKSFEKGYRTMEDHNLYCSTVSD